MLKKLMLIALAGIALLTITDNTYGWYGGGYRDGGHWDGGHRWGGGGWHHGPAVIIIPPRIRPVFCFPPRGIIISPTIFLGSPPPVTEVVVASPPTQVVVTREVVHDETVVAWVTNDNGSRTEVRLTRTNDGGYVGPKGEYYSSMPTQEQLETLYAVRSQRAKPSNITEALFVYECL